MKVTELMYHTAFRLTANPPHSTANRGDQTVALYQGLAAFRSVFFRLSLLTHFRIIRDNFTQGFCSIFWQW